MLKIKEIVIGMVKELSYMSILVAVLLIMTNLV